MIDAERITLEHADYMARSADILFSALEKYETVCGADGEEHDPDEICDAEEEYACAVAGLRLAIHEYRKRRNRLQEESQ